MSTKQKIYGNESHGLVSAPFALNFASLQEGTTSVAEELGYDSKLQISEFSKQTSKVWNAAKTCTIMTPVGNDPKDSIPDYDQVD